MELRSLGASDLRVSVVTFGAMGLGAADGADDERCAAVLRAALDEGVNAIDTAPLYGFGRSERVVARAITDRRPRPQRPVFQRDDDRGRIVVRLRLEQHVFVQIDFARRRAIAPYE